MGKKTTVYLSSDREQAMEATGHTLLEIIDLGLEAAAGTKAGTSVSSRRREKSGACKHPRARRAKGLCMACGTYQGDA